MKNDVVLMKDLVETYNRELAWSTLPQLAQWVVEEAVRIQQIPAPTFAEAERAAYVAEQFKQFGLEAIDTDDRLNVYGMIPGENRKIPGVLVVAHTDTVFPAETDLKVVREGDTIAGPGLGDNSMGVAGMLGLIKMLRDHHITPLCDLWVVATSCEEGLGDLNGMRAAFARVQPHIGAVINLEGLAFGHIYHAGIAVHRLHITATAAGGHSWLHFGRASAVHGIIMLGERILRLQPPRLPRTTYNIGLLSGGQSINSIATEASLWLDLRSESPDLLEKLRQEVYAQIKALESPDLQFSVEVVSQRPAGHIRSDHALVQGALAALGLVGIRGSLEAGSTDGNIPLAAGCPTITIGITRGGNAHRLDEYIEIQPVQAGMRQLIIMAMATAEYQYSLQQT